MVIQIKLIVVVVVVVVANYIKIVLKFKSHSLDEIGE